MKYFDKDIYIPVLENGDKIYHYTSAAGLYGICEKEFWITERHFLNDSSEFQIGTEVFLQIMKESILNSHIYAEMEKQLRQELYCMGEPGKVGEKRAYSGDYVISFCLDEDSALLWSEYSNFMGYCMCFDFEKLLAAFQDRSIFHGTVIYDHNIQKDCLCKTIDSCFKDQILGDTITSWEAIKNMKEQEIEEFVIYASVLCDIYNMFFKKKCFEGKHEYRFIFSCGHDGGRYKDKDLVPQYFRIKDEVFIPYIKRQLSDLEGLESVTIGPKNKSDIAVRGLQYYFRNKKMNIVVKQSEMPLRY